MTTLTISATTVYSVDGVTYIPSPMVLSVRDEEDK